MSFSSAATLSRPAPASRVPSIPSVPAVAPAGSFARPRIAPPTPRALAERAAGEAAAVLAAEERCLAGAHECVADAERTHSEAITWGKRKRVAIPGAPFSAERMAERRAFAAARVAECERRVAASGLTLARARRVLARLAAESAP